MGLNWVGPTGRGKYKAPYGAKKKVEYIEGIQNFTVNMLDNVEMFEIIFWIFHFKILL